MDLLCQAKRICQNTAKNLREIIKLCTTRQVCTRKTEATRQLHVPMQCLYGKSSFPWHPKLSNMLMIVKIISYTLQAYINIVFQWYIWSRKGSNKCLANQSKLKPSEGVIFALHEWVRSIVTGWVKLKVEGLDCLLVCFLIMGHPYNYDEQPLRCVIVWFCFFSLFTDGDSSTKLQRKVLKSSKWITAHAAPPKPMVFWLPTILPHV